MSLRKLLEGTDRRVLIIILSSGVLLALYMNYGSATFAGEVLEKSPHERFPVVWQFLSCLVCLGVLPTLIWMVALRRRPQEMGLGAGDLSFGLKLCAIALPLVILPIAFIATRMPDIRAEYPLARDLGRDLGPLVAYQAMYLLYYIGWEAFFRGYLILGLRDKMGDFAAIGLSMLVSVAIHYGKPPGEVWGAVVAGVLFGWLAIRTRSILYPLILHAGVGVLTDVIVIFGPGGGS